MTDRLDLAPIPPARVVRVDRGLVMLLTDEAGPLRATLGSELLERMARDSTAGPCTGDRCELRRWPDGPVTVERVLPRGPSIVRADVNGSSRGQVLAANIDVVAVVVGLVPEPAIGRVERLLTVAWASGAPPAVVLTKADLVTDAEQIAEDVRAIAPGVPVIIASTATGAGVGELRSLVGSGTMALIGSSGAGKSSLVNALVGAEVLTTKQIREDGRGRHTSVRRELVVLPGGGAVIDTPGLRGVGLLGAEDGLVAGFDDIEALVARCRFRDCSHAGEPGCAVLAAVEAGTLPVRRLDSWRKLHAEAVRMTRRRRGKQLPK